MDAEKMMMQKRIDNLCEQLEMLKNKLEEEKTHHQHTLECAQQFEKDWLKMKRERDAAVHDIWLSCDTCKHKGACLSDDFCEDCEHAGGDNAPCCSCHNLCEWEWRGLCAENGGDDKWMEK